MPSVTPEQVASRLCEKTFSEWAMLGSNQVPLPCECKIARLPLFVHVQKFLQTIVFCSIAVRHCSHGLEYYWCT
jgi:hypothetical protein